MIDIKSIASNAIASESLATSSGLNDYIPNVVKGAAVGYVASEYFCHDDASLGNLPSPNTFTYALEEYITR